MITLCMIVKNEEKTIADTLRHALPATDSACIVDTGSTDRTIELTDRMIRGLRGGSCLVAKPWKDFSTNRNECLQLAEERFGHSAWEQMKESQGGDRLPARWWLMLDADSRLFGASYLMSYLQRSEASEHSAYYIHTICGEDEYGMCRVFRAGSGWHYEGRVHELPVHRREEPGPMIPGVWIEYRGTDRASKEATWLEYLDLLHLDLAEGVNPDRTRFYLAQTYACLGYTAAAIRHYQIRFHSKGGSQGERWEAGLRLAQLLLQESPEDAIEYCLELSARNKTRAEPYYFSALAHQSLGDTEVALTLAQVATWYAADIPVGPMFVRRDIYRYKAKLLLAKLALASGLKRVAVQEYSELAKLQLPEADRLYVAQQLATMQP